MTGNGELLDLSCLTGVGAISNSVSVLMNNSGELCEVSDSGRLIACVTGGGVEMSILFSSSVGSSTMEGAGDRGPTGIRSGTDSKVGLKGVFLDF